MIHYDFIEKFINDLAEKYHIPDTYASEVVRAIYKWKLEGMSQGRIAEKLNLQGVLCPMEYKLSMGIKVQTNFKVRKQALWSPRSVTRILTNEIYTGALIQGKTSTPNYKVKKKNRKALVEKVLKIYENTGINLPTLELDNQIVDIDPFTFFGLFNKK